MDNEVSKKNNLGLHIPVFTMLTGFIILDIHSLFTKDPLQLCGFQEYH